MGDPIVRRVDKHLPSDEGRISINRGIRIHRIGLYTAKLQAINRLHHWADIGTRHRRRRCRIPCGPRSSKGPPRWPFALLMRNESRGLPKGVQENAFVAEDGTSCFARTDLSGGRSFLKSAS